MHRGGFLLGCMAAARGARYSSCAPAACQQEPAGGASREAAEARAHARRARRGHHPSSIIMHTHDTRRRRALDCVYSSEHASEAFTRLEEQHPRTTDYSTFAGILTSLHLFTCTCRRILPVHVHCYTVYTPTHPRPIGRTHIYYSTPIHPYLGTTAVVRARARRYRHVHVYSRPPVRPPAHSTLTASPRRGGSLCDAARGKGRRRACAEGRNHSSPL
eukprot:COSAG05_NODE_2942_length_2480_cov_1.382192_3_plen_217_part_00